jgi:hypothetical protein
MRVLFLSHYFPPEIGAAPARIAELAGALARRGAQVAVHTGHPHYPAGGIAPGYRNRLLSSEDHGAVRVLRSLVYPAANTGFSRRVLDHSVFAASSIATCPSSGPVDVLIAETPPLFTALAGVLYARVKRAALILNVSDLWPESAIELGALSNPAAIALSESLARYCYRHAAAITAPTEGIVRALSAMPQAAGKVRHIPPAVDLERFGQTGSVTPSSERPLRVLYAGTLGIAQSLHSAVTAAAIAGPEIVELQIAGAGPEAQRLQSMVSEMRLTNVRFHGAIASSGVPDLYGQVDAGLVCLRDLALFEGALPSKLFEVLAAGRAVVLAARGESARMIEEQGSGIALAPQDPHALAGAFRRLQADPLLTARMGERARSAAAPYSRVHAVTRWSELIQQTAPHRSWPAVADRSPVDPARAPGGNTDGLC